MVEVSFRCEYTRENYISPLRPNEPVCDIYTVQEIAFEGDRLKLSSLHTTTPEARDAQERHDLSPSLFPPYPYTNLGMISLQTCFPAATADKLATFATTHYAEGVYKGKTPDRRCNFNCHQFAAYMLGVHTRVSEDDPQIAFDHEAAEASVPAARPGVVGFSSWINRQFDPEHSFLQVTPVCGEGIDQPMTLSVLGRGGLLAFLPFHQLVQAYSGPKAIVRRIQVPQG